MVSSTSIELNKLVTIKNDNKQFKMVIAAFSLYDIYHSIVNLYSHYHKVLYMRDNLTFQLMATKEKKSKWLTSFCLQLFDVR